MCLKNPHMQGFRWVSSIVLTSSNRKRSFPTTAKRWSFSSVKNVHFTHARFAIRACSDRWIQQGQVSHSPLSSWKGRRRQRANFGIPRNWPTMCYANKYQFRNDKNDSGNMLIRILNSCHELWWRISDCDDLTRYAGGCPFWFQWCSVHCKSMLLLCSVLSEIPVLIRRKQTFVHIIRLLPCYLSSVTKRNLSNCQLHFVIDKDLLFWTMATRRREEVLWLAGKVLETKVLWLEKSTSQNKNRLIREVLSSTD